MEDGENVGVRTAGVELGGEGMVKKIVFSALFVGIQCIVEDELEIRDIR